MGNTPKHQRFKGQTNILELYYFIKEEREREHLLIFVKLNFIKVLIVVGTTYAASK